MVHIDSYLYLSRHSIYYFRAIVPNGIREGLHKREYRRSMQTRSLHVARGIGRALRVCFETHLAGLRSSMISWEELRKKLDTKLEQLISQERETLRKVGPYPLVADDIWKFNTIPNCQQAIQAISELRSVHMSDIPSGTIPVFAQDLAENILQSSNINLDRSSDLFMQFCEATLRMCLEFTQQRVLLNDEARSFQVNQHTPNSSFHFSSPKPVDTELLSEVAETFRNERVSTGMWTEKTETEYRAAHNLLINVIHDTPIAQINYTASQYFKKILPLLPSNMNKKPLYRDAISSLSILVSLSLATARIGKYWEGLS